MVLGSEGRLGIITEATVQVRRAARPSAMILGYLFPSWAEALAAMRDIAASEAAPSVTRVVRRLRDARSRFATKKGSPRSTGSSRAALQDVPASAARASTSSEMCLVVHRLRGHGAPRRRASARRSGEIVAAHGGLCIGASPGELYDQKKFDTPVHPRLPARPRRARRRLRDRGAVERAAHALRRRDGGGPRRVRRARRPRLHHVPPVALLPRGRVPVLHVRVHAARRSDAARRSTAW